MILHVTTRRQHSPPACWYSNCLVVPRSRPPDVVPMEEVVEEENSLPAGQDLADSRTAQMVDTPQDRLVPKDGQAADTCQAIAEFSHRGHTGFVVVTRRTAGNEVCSYLS